MSNNNTYEISGRVINAASEDGIYGMKVEVWDKDDNDQRLLDKATTGTEGNFRFCFDDTYFKDEYPDVFFRVLRGKKVLMSTEDEPIPDIKNNLEGIVLPVDVPGIQRERVDRSSPKETIEAIRDFAGFSQQTIGQSAIPIKLAGDIINNAISAINFNNFEIPREVPSPGSELIGKDIDNVSNILEEQGVHAEKFTYQPGLNGETFRAMRFLPVDISSINTEQQQVNLYTQDDDNIVVCYAVVPRTHDAGGVIIKGQALEKSSSHEANLAECKAQITRLQKEVKELKTSLDAMNKLMQSDKFLELMKTTKAPAAPKKTRTRRKKTPTDTDGSKK